jgi:Family of unknown function (DUF6498)
VSTPYTIENTRSLIVTNVSTIGLALFFQWPLGLLLFPYWFQSVIIGWFSRERILALHSFSTEGFKINGSPVEATQATKRSTANFFALHYGFFHLAYFFVVLKSVRGLTALDWLGLATAAIAFAWNHRASFQRNIEADRRGKPNIGTLMFLPYLRILPMHLTILFGGAIVGAGFNAWAILLFGALKTGADVAMHIVEHRLLQYEQKNPPSPAT